MTYQVPLKDIRFVLSELAELPAVCTLPGYEDCNVELVDAILDEAAKFAEGCSPRSTATATRATPGRTTR